MASSILSGSQEFIHGDVKNLSIVVYDGSSNGVTNLATATATMAVYAGDDSVILAAGAAIVTGTTNITITRSWDTSAVAAGEYRCVTKITFGSIIENKQHAVTVLNNPAPK